MEREGQKEPLSYEDLARMFDKFDGYGRYAEAERVCYVMFNVAPEKQGEILYRLGLLWWRCGEIDLAEQLFLQADESLATRDPMRIRISNELSLIYQARGAWIGPHGSLIGWIGLLEKRKRFGENQNLRTALEYSQKSLEVLERLNHDFKKTPEGHNFWTHTLDVQGLALTASGDFLPAFQNHLQVIDKASKIGDKSAIACARNNQGVVCYFMGKQKPEYFPGAIDEAEKCFRQRLEEDEDKTSVGHAIVLSNLARVLEAQGKEDEAAEIYSQCLDLYLSLFGPTLLWDATETNHPLLWDARRNIAKLTPPGAVGG